VTYRTNTLGGSSGSPCFNADLELIALHHGSDPDFHPAHTPEYNEGIPFDTILARLANKGLSGLLGK
jgi:V8-like Glu-specific endopeptidase